jgi:hypothetical protein
MQRLVDDLCTLSNALFALPRVTHVNTRFPKLECCPCDSSATSDNRTNNPQPVRLPFFNPLRSPTPISPPTNSPTISIAILRGIGTTTTITHLNALRIAGERQEQGHIWERREEIRDANFDPGVQGSALARVTLELKRCTTTSFFRNYPTEDEYILSRAKVFESANDL